jgi:hypothetical protein
LATTIGNHRELRQRLVHRLGDRQVGLEADALQGRVGIAATVRGLERRDHGETIGAARRRAAHPHFVPAGDGDAHGPATPAASADG